MKNKYPFKTNEFIEEEVNIPSFEPVVKEDHVEFKQTTKKATRKTFYSDQKPKQVICTNHKYICLDKGKYSFKCVKCSWHKIAFPHLFKFDPETGILSNRKTGARV